MQAFKASRLIMTRHTTILLAYLHACAVILLFRIKPVVVGMGLAATG